MTDESVSDWNGIEIYTVGHSTRTLEQLVSLLRSFRVTLLVDVRSIPRSRRNPQFNGDSLGAALGPVGLEYLQIRRLGGLRRPRPDSPNAG
jgi:uncharacterized protein (DUF488 family)